jgi:fermentation-respiration switch protein FrsA (DUF1100 family)
VALSLSRSERLDLVVTIGTFTRLREMASGLTRGLLPNEYDNRRAAREIDEPWYLVHGTGDEVVPWKQGEELHKIAAATKRQGASFVVLGASHRPDAEILLSILSTIEVHRTAGKLTPEGLPESVKLFPFAAGQAPNP